jgi:hypothetical protein
VGDCAHILHFFEYPVSGALATVITRFINKCLIWQRSSVADPVSGALATVITRFINKCLIWQRSSVADLVSGAFLTPGTGI